MQTGCQRATVIADRVHFNARLGGSSRKPDLIWLHSASPKFMQVDLLTICKVHHVLPCVNGTVRSLQPSMKLGHGNCVLNLAASGSCPCRTSPKVPSRCTAGKKLEVEVRTSCHDRPHLQATRCTNEPWPAVAMNKRLSTQNERKSHA